MLLAQHKISGAAAGIARYLGLDPTIVRIAFVVGAIFSQGAAVVLYLILSFVMPPADGDDEGPKGAQDGGPKDGGPRDGFIRVTRD